jgi:hypothetical protein
MAFGKVKVDQIESSTQVVDVDNLITAASTSTPHQQNPHRSSDHRHDP